MHPPDWKPHTPYGVRGLSLIVTTCTGELLLADSHRAYGVVLWLAETANRFPIDEEAPGDGALFSKVSLSPPSHPFFT